MRHRVSRTDASAIPDSVFLEFSADSFGTLPSEDFGSRTFLVSGGLALSGAVLLHDTDASTLDLLWLGFGQETATFIGSTHLECRNSSRRIFCSISAPPSHLRQSRRLGFCSLFVSRSSPAVAELA